MSPNTALALDQTDRPRRHLAGETVDSWVLQNATRRRKASAQTHVMGGEPLWTTRWMPTLEASSAPEVNDALALALNRMRNGDESSTIERQVANRLAELNQDLQLDYPEASISVESLQYLAQFLRGTAFARVPSITANRHGIITATWRASEFNRVSVRFAPSGAHVVVWIVPDRRLPGGCSVGQANASIESLPALLAANARSILDSESSA